MKASPEIEAGVMATLSGFAKTYENRDMEGLVSYLVPDPDVVIIGSGADEKRVGIAEIMHQVERDWAQSEAASMDIQNPMVSAAGKAAWLTCDVILHAKVGGKDINMPAFRLTAVFEQRGKKWFMTQWHLSLPSYSQKEGESFPG